MAVKIPNGTFQERFNKLESFCKTHHQDTTVPVRLKNLDIKFASKITTILKLNSLELVKVILLLSTLEFTNEHPEGT